MAEAYGNQVYHWRVHVAAWAIWESETQMTIRMQTRIQAMGWGYNVYCNGNVSGIWQSADSGRVTFYSPYGGWTDQTLASKDVTVTKTANVQQWNITGTANVTGGYHNGTSQAVCTVTIPAIKHKQPHNVKSLAATRNSDTSVTMTWAGDYTDQNGFYPWNGINIYRAVDNGSAGKLAGIAWNSTKYTDSTTAKGHSYQYVVKPYNDAGEATGSWTGIIRMTPSDLASITVQKLSGTSVRCIVPEPTYYDSIQFQRTADGGTTWVNVSMTKDGKGYVDSNAPAGTLKYRARAVYGSLTSGWVTSGSITTICAPNAPGVTALSTVYSHGSTITVKWTPNHPDGTAQSSAQVEVTVGSTVTTNDISGTTTAYSFKADTNATVKVRVRTHGLYDGWGAWSTYTTTTVADLPVSVFTNPATDGSEISGLPLTLEWTVLDDTGVSSQNVKVSRTINGAVLVNKDLGGSIRSLDLDETSGLEDGGNYTAALTVRGGSGLTDTASRRFIAKWEAPDAPTATVKVDESYTAFVTIAAATTGDIATDHLRVARINPDGTVTALGETLSDGDVVIDRLPPLNTPYKYRIAAVALTGAVSYTETDAEVTADGKEVYNFGSNAATILALGLDASSSETLELTGETFDFALGTNADCLPEFYADGGITGSGTHSYNVLTQVEYNEARRLSRLYSTGWYRDAWGHVARVQTKFSFGYAAKSYSLWSIDITTTELMWRDPVNG